MASNFLMGTFLSDPLVFLRPFHLYPAKRAIYRSWSAHAPTTILRQDASSDRITA